MYLLVALLSVGNGGFMYLFSAKTLAFYPEQMKEIYQEAGSLPADVVEVSDEQRDKYNAQAPDNFKLGVDDNGWPAWVTLSSDEFMSQASAIKQGLIKTANHFINDKQWPGKAAIGRLKGDELAQYNLWLDYLDALEAVDTSSAPAIEWPTPPVSAAE